MPRSCFSIWLWFSLSQHDLTSLLTPSHCPSISPQLQLFQNTNFTNLFPKSFPLLRFVFWFVQCYDIGAVLKKCCYIDFFPFIKCGACHLGITHQKNRIPWKGSRVHHENSFSAKIYPNIFLVRFRIGIIWSSSTQLWYWFGRI
jgi:hypothetical protein